MPNTIYFITGDLRDQQTLLAGLPFDGRELLDRLGGLSTFESPHPWNSLNFTTTIVYLSNKTTLYD